MIVQNEFLKALEGVANVSASFGKYHNMNTDNVLFIFAGRVNGRREYHHGPLR